MTEGGERRGIISARREGGEICVRGTGYFSLKGGIREGKREESRRKGREGDKMNLLRGRSQCQRFFSLEEGGEGGIG